MDASKQRNQRGMDKGEAGEQADVQGERDWRIIS